MCVGAIGFLMLGRMLGMRTAFLIVAGTVLAIAVMLVVAVREPSRVESEAAEVTFGSLADAAWSALRGVLPGLRPIFVATFLLQLTFQTFTTWYARHATERFGIRAEDVTIGFIGRVFDLLDGYRAMFALMAGYAALAFMAVLFVPRGVGEADTGPDEGRAMRRGAGSAGSEPNVT
jgi:hypothetical protein